VHPRLGKAAPPDFVSVANHPTLGCSAKRTSIRCRVSFFALVFWVWVR
jgi:hypothetical protein